MGLRQPCLESGKEFFMSNDYGQFCPLIPHNLDLVLGIANLAGYIYKFLGDDVILLHNKYLKWKQELGDQFCEGVKEFGDLHRDIYSVTNIPKYRSFQYRLLQWGLVTNIQLEKWQILPSNLCTFCKKEPEEILHLLAHCPEVEGLWNSYIQYIDTKYGVKPICTPTNIILNRVVKKKNHVANFLCLIVKYYIYSQRCQRKSLHFPILKGLMISIENIEKYIALKNDRLSKHYRKWSVF